MTTTKDENNKKWNFLGIIDWHTQQIQQQPEDETKSDKPIQGLKLLYGHEWLLTLFLSLSLCLQLSLSASLPLSLHPSRPLYISSYFYLLLLYSLFYISLFKNDTILKKSKNDRKDSFKGRLVFSSNQHTWSSQKKKKKSTHMDKIHVHIIIIQPLLKKKKSQQKQNYTNNIFFLKKNH